MSVDFVLPDEKIRVEMLSKLYNRDKRRLQTCHHLTQINGEGGGSCFKNCFLNNF